MCLYVYPPHNKFWTPVQILVKLGLHIMPTEAIITAYYINPSLQ
jgi:hypothetical protein